MTERRCESCHRIMIRNPRESRAKFLRSRFCSLACRNRGGYPRTPVEPKPCKNCKRVIGRRPGEGPKQYRRRQFCSPKCRHVHKSRASRLRWNGSDNRPKPAPIRLTLPAATQQEWLELNGGPTICPTRYVAPIFHEIRSERFAPKDGRVR